MMLKERSQAFVSELRNVNVVALCRHFFGQDSPSFFLEIVFERNVD